LTEAQKRARNKYQKKVKKLTLDFCPSEKDLLEQIHKQPNKQGYIKRLIRNDMRFKNVCNTAAAIAKGVAEAEANAATAKIETYINKKKG
jgi:hypothetical protein